VPDRGNRVTAHFVHSERAADGELCLVNDASQRSATCNAILRVIEPHGYPYPLPAGSGVAGSVTRRCRSTQSRKLRCGSVSIPSGLGTWLTPKRKTLPPQRGSGALPDCVPYYGHGTLSRTLLGNRCLASPRLLSQHFTMTWRLWSPFIRACVRIWSIGSCSLLNDLQTRDVSVARVRIMSNRHRCSHSLCCRLFVGPSIQCHVVR